MSTFDGDVQILEKIQETPTKKSYLFIRPNDFDFQPGQFVVISLSRFSGAIMDSFRQFSISSSPRDNYVSITTQIIGRNSAFKDFLDSLSPGDSVRLSGPSGSFTMGDNTHRVALLAGGVGVTPFRSMIRHLAETSFSGEIRLLHSSRTYEETLFYHEIKDIQAKVQWLKVYRFMTRETKKMEGVINGRMSTDYLRSIVVPFNPDECLISGPPSFVETINKVLVSELKLDPFKIKMERFEGYK